MLKGSVRNHSSKVLWVVETDDGKPTAHKLAPMYQSPINIDADAFRAVDGTSIDGHTSWVKIINLSTANIKDAENELTRGCLFCRNVDDNEFGLIHFDESDGWGEPIAQA